MSCSRRNMLKIVAGAGLASAFFPLEGAPLVTLDAFAKSGNNGNGGGNGKGGGNSGGNGNSSAGGGNGNGNSGNGKGNGGPATSAEPADAGMTSAANGVQATRSADGSIRIRHRNGIIETIVSNRYVMKDPKGRTISNRIATQADVTRLSRFLH